MRAVMKMHGASWRAPTSNGLVSFLGGRMMRRSQTMVGRRGSYLAAAAPEKPAQGLNGFAISSSKRRLTTIKAQSASRLSRKPMPMRGKS